MEPIPTIQPVTSDQKDAQEELGQKPLDTEIPKSYLSSQVLKRLILIFFILIIILPLGIILYQRIRGKTINFISKKEQRVTKSMLQSLISAIQTPTPTAIPIAIITGNLKQLATDLQLISHPDFPITYYEAGTFSTGSYANYKRIVAVYEQYTEGGTTCGDSVFLTKDDTNYLTSVDRLNTGEYNKNKVTQNPSIDFSKDYTVPSVMQLDQNFSLSLNNYDSLSFKNTYSNPPDCTLNLPTNKNMFSLSSSSGYDIYSINNLNNPIISTDTSVIVVDKAGLPFQYLLSEEESHKYLMGAGPGQYSTSTDNIFAYNDGGLRESKFKDPGNFYKYEFGFNANYPDYPRFTPDFSALKPNDFTQIDGINGNIPIYILSDSAATPIYQTRYQKIPGIAKTYANVTPSSGNQSSFQTPTYEQYVQKHPFIFIKDFWGRFVLLEEIEYGAYMPPGPMIGG